MFRFVYGMITHPNLIFQLEIRIRITSVGGAWEWKGTQQASEGALFIDLSGVTQLYSVSANPSSKALKSAFLYLYCTLSYK